MIYTLTLNPALDYYMHPSELNIGGVNRSKGEEFVAGGKGLNVSSVLTRLGAENIALGFAAGFTGDILERLTKEQGIAAEFIRLDSGLTRINVKVRTDVVTEINGQGADIPDSALIALYDRLDRLCAGDMLILAGSIPNSLPRDIYEKIMSRLSEKKIRFAVDCTGELLLRTLKYRPFVIKPNHIELEETAGEKLCNKDDLIRAAERLQKLGARNVLVSMGEYGGMLYTEDGRAEFCPAPKGEVKNTVGAGDSMLAGFIAGAESGLSLSEALILGVSAGSAAAFSDALPEKENIYELYRKTAPHH